MDPTIISDTIQEFAGKRYYLCGRYFQRSGRRLHVAVWEAANGPVPQGHAVHHRDHVKVNNALANLELLARSAHVAHHNRTITPAQRAARRLNARAASEGNARLTREERSMAGKAGWETRTTTTVHCTVCGCEVETWTPTRTKFCGGTCKARALRSHLRGGRAATRTGVSTLTAEQVAEIRRLIARGTLTQREIGARFGVKQPTISHIATNNSWRQ
jgi:hypothetical protein